MSRSFREEEIEMEEPGRDTEFTLGPAMLIALFCGLILLCGLCFGLGYSSGRRSAAHSAVAITQTDGGQTQVAQPGSTLQKPMAKGTIPVSPPQPPTADITPPASGDGSASGNALTSYAPPASNPGASPGPSPEVHAALPAPGIAPASNAPSAPIKVQPAMAQGSSLMVQVAAVSRAEDASVLMAALRKRGYNVALRRELNDNLIHVQIGPFANRADANAMSQKLLSDGYNAVVLP